MRLVRIIDREALNSKPSSGCERRPAGAVVPSCAKSDLAPSILNARAARKSVFEYGINGYEKIIHWEVRSAYSKGPLELVT